MLKRWMWMRSPRQSVARTVGGGLSLGGHWSLRTEWRDSRLQERRGILNVRNHKPGNVLEVKESKCQGRRDKLTRKSCWTERQKKSTDRHSLLRAIGKSHVVFRDGALIDTRVQEFERWKEIEGERENVDNSSETRNWTEMLFFLMMRPESFFIQGKTPEEKGILRKIREMKWWSKI